MLQYIKFTGKVAVRANAPILRNCGRCLFQGAQFPSGQRRHTNKTQVCQLDNTVNASSRTLATSTQRWGLPAQSAFEDHAVLYSKYNWMKSIPMTEVDKDSDPSLVIVHWDDGDSQKYPCVWLRSNCHCEKCYSTGAHGKLKYMQDLDLDIKAHAASLKADGHVLTITWSDNHVTTIPSNWLRCNRFDQSEVDPVSDAKLDLWGSDVMSSGRLRTFSFHDLMNSSEALLDWLAEIKVLGISIVKDVPVKSHQIHKLAERVGYITPSTFGTHSDIIAVEDGDMLGFSNGYLQPHTDFSYYVNPPGIGLFHCIKNTSSTGGESMLIDAFKAVVELKETNPEAFRMLTTYEVEHVAIAQHKKITKEGFYHHARHPMIRLGAFGQLKQVTFNEIYHASLVRVPVDDIIPMFSAMKAFNKILLRKDNVFEYKLQAGDILTFDNHRMLHGRRAYASETALVERHLQTCFVDWDCVLSRLRVLQKSRLQ